MINILNDLVLALICVLTIFCIYEVVTTIVYMCLYKYNVKHALISALIGFLSIFRKN